MDEHLARERGERSGVARVELALCRIRVALKGAFLRFRGFR